MAQMIRDREISPVELIQAHLRQIQDANPRLNAFVVVMAEEALAAAKQAEAAVVQGDSLGLLHGVPVTVKDSFDVADLPTLAGSRFRLGHRAESDATSVARLRAAGAIILGKTNCPEFLSNYESDNYVTGRSNNPWDLERTPGGSSGGEAAAIASFCSAGGIGSDGGGSIRIPAHFCGIAGLKPTPGRISAAGHFPPIYHPGGLLGVAGPMARSAQDLRLLFAALAGYDDQDPFSAPVPLRVPVVADLRIGLMEQFYRDARRVCDERCSPQRGAHAGANRFSCRCLRTARSGASAERLVVLFRATPCPVHEEVDGRKSRGSALDRQGVPGAGVWHNRLRRRRMWCGISRNATACARVFCVRWVMCLCCCCRRAVSLRSGIGSVVGKWASRRSDSSRQ